MSRNVRFSSNTLIGQAFDASATFGGQTESVSITSWGGGGGDTTPPVLSNPTGTKAGSSGGVGGVSTNEGNGTLHWVVTTSATTPSAAQIKAGQTHTGAAAADSGSQTVTDTGTLSTSPSASGLQDDTNYRFHFVQTDTAGNDSNTATSPIFRTDPQGSAVGTLNITIPRRMYNSLGKEAVFFRATANVAGITTAAISSSTYDESASELIYNWTVSRSGYTNVSSKVVNTPAAWNDLTTMQSREPCHVFTAPGTYTVACTCLRESDGALVGTDSINVTISAANLPTTQTILVNAAGAGNGAYPGANVVTTLGAALSALRSLPGLGRILLNRGETFTTGAYTFNGNETNVYIGAYGSGARPRINASGLNATRQFRIAGAFAGDFILDGVEMYGGYNPDTETGNQCELIELQGGPNVPNILITDCIMRNGFSNFIYGGTANTGNNPMIVIHDTEIRDWMQYGMFIGKHNNDQWVGLLGVRSTQSEQAMMGGFDKGDIVGGGTCNQHGPLRFAEGGHFYLDVLDFYSRNGWAAGAPIAPPGGMQACIRFHTSPNREGHGKRSSGMVTRAAFEGGSAAMNIGDSGGGNQSANTGYGLIIDKCIHAATPDTRQHIQVSAAGVTIRNFFGHVPQVYLDNASRSFRTPVLRGSPSGNFPDASWPINIYNCTFINERSQNGFDGDQINDIISGGGPSHPTPIRANNWQWLPNFASAAGNDGNPNLVSTRLATVGGNWTSRHFGFKYRNAGAGAQLTMQTAFASPPDLMDTGTPNTGSSLINTATTGRTAWDDLYGSQRTGTPDRGAVEV